MSGRFVSNQEFLKKLVEKTESNLTNDQFGVTELARQMGMSRSNLHLRVKKLTKLSVSQFINQIRLKKAMELLKPGTSTIAQIAFDCGFRSVSYFTKCFREYYGFTPGEVGKYAGTEKIGKKKRKITIIINNRWILISLLMLGIIVPVAIISYNSLVEIAFTSRTDDLENTIAVLPFKNLNNDKDYDYLSAGIVETINRYLFQVSDLKVISVTSAEQFMDSDKSAKDIRQELKVTHLLEGSIQRDKNMMRIEVKLIDTDTESQVWAEYYDIELRTQSDIA
jgi:TolB-like protein/AraC-like DNA-binding protein